MIPVKKLTGLTIVEVVTGPAPLVGGQQQALLTFSPSVGPGRRLDLPSTVTRGSRFYKSSSDTSPSFSLAQQTHCVCPSCLSPGDCTSDSYANLCHNPVPAGGDREGLISFSSGGPGNSGGVENYSLNSPCPSQAGWVVS